MLYTNLTKKALKISFQAHKNQLDKSGIPYVYHPFHLAEQMDDEYSVCVALLHDVVEDTEMTIDDLTEQGFPREVTEALLLMTHDDSVPYMDYIKKIKTNSLATKVKLADLEHNSDLTRLDEINDAALERADKYRQAMFLLRSVERVERKIKVVPALETSCCHVKVPLDYRYCSSCGKKIVDAAETEMEYDSDGPTLLFCHRCSRGIFFKDHFCGYCGAKSRFWKEEDAELQNRIRGSLTGGAAGDALGYAVEFMGENELFGKYGKGGIRAYSLDSVSKKALISDDTQMTLFAAEAIIKWLSAQANGGADDSLRSYALQSHLDWLDTQESTFERAGKQFFPHGLMAERRMFACRAPGITCLSALHKRRNQKQTADSFIADKINNSKGCGGVMRVAPVGMLKYGEIRQIDNEGAEFAAITHSHSLGYMPAALLTHIIHSILYSDAGNTLQDIVEDALDAVAGLFRDDAHIGELVEIIRLAIELSDNDARDLDNIHRLGEGWVAEEALAIAIYCCLRYPYDFSQCIITAVNHKGDSDSTGAIAGNIIGAYLGYDEIEEKWKEDLELSDVILGVADHLYSELIS